MSLDWLKKNPTKDKKIPTPSKTAGGSLGRFFRNPYVSAGIIVFALVGTVMLLASNAANYVATSARSGQWSDPNTWVNSRVPKPGNKVVISSGQTITLDTDTRISGLDVSPRATLAFSPGKSVQMQTDKNIIVRGTLSMVPRSNAQEHSITFIGVNNAKFKGGGMNPTDSDVGLWVMDTGQLNVQGAPKTAWTNVSGGLKSGQKAFGLKTRPTGWEAGDELFVSPTQPPTDAVSKSAWEGFDEASITKVSGQEISTQNPLKYDHPKVGTRWTAEIGNLTRNVKIQGTESGNAHIFIRSAKPQTIRYAELKYMGVEQNKPDESKHTGRYALHFHHSGDGSKGSTVEGVVVHKGRNHSYVPHASHGITFKDTIAYDMLGTAYWWDPDNKDARDSGMPNTSNDITIDHAIAARINGRGIRIGGFRLGEGAANTNTVKNSVAVGVVGGEQSAGFTWEAGTDPWNFNDNIAHNNKSEGILVWQNDTKNHVIKNFTAYHNYYGIFHGAYKNHYKYKNLNLYGNKEAGIFLNATSDKGILRFDNIRIDGGGVGRVGIKACCHKVSGNKYPTIFEGGFIRNVNFGVIMNKSEQKGVGAWLQFNNVRMNTKGDYYLHSIIEPSSSLEVNNGTGHYCLTTQAISGRGSVFIKSQNAWQTRLISPHTSGTTTSTGC